MSTDKKSEDQVAEAGAAELGECELDQASGGTDAAQRSRVTSLTVSFSGQTSAGFGDGSVRFVSDSI